MASHKNRKNQQSQQSAVARPYLYPIQFSQVAVSLSYIGHSNNSAGNSAAGVTDGLSAVIRFGMHNDTAAEDRVLRPENRNIMD